MAITEGSGEARIRLSGLLGNSALGICAVTVRTHGGRVNIILRQRLSNGVYSGSFDREFSVPAGVHEVSGAGTQLSGGGNKEDLGTPLFPVGRLARTLHQQIVMLSPAENMVQALIG